MNNDLRHVSPSFLHLQKEMGRIKLFQPPAFALYDQVERAMRPIRQHHLEIARLTTTPDFASARVVDIVKSNQHWQDMMDRATASTRVFTDLTRTHRSWLRDIKPMQDHIAQLQVQAKLSLDQMVHRLTVSERLLASIDFDKLCRGFAPQESAVARLRDAVRCMAANYGSLTASIHSYTDFTDLPSFALPGATREVFLTGYAVDVLQAPTDQEAGKYTGQLVVEAEQETSICVAMLQKVDPALARPYAGARDALQSSNPDRARHILSSLRELWNHLLRQLAPDDQVLTWVPQGKSDLLYNGRPTRRARVLYVCRNLNHEPLSDFVDQDTSALVKLVEFFNRVHQLESELTDEQLRALLLRTDSWLTYILNIWEGTK